MTRHRFLFRLAFALMGVGAVSLPLPGAEPAAGMSEAAAGSNPLVWDAKEKSVDAKPGDAVAEFEFAVTNRSEAPIEILALRASCGCTVAEMPSKPWVLAPGAKSSFRATVDFGGKHGRFSKTVFVRSTAGGQMLSMTVNIPEPDPATRLRNQQLAAANRQAVFRGDCAACHVTPAVGKMGPELFQAACAICHLASPRAEVVPNLLEAREPRDAAYWRKWIEEGREGSLMPAFAERHGGPLTPEQIESLIEFALRQLPSGPRKN